jgi:hypothetical protein
MKETGLVVSVKDGFAVVKLEREIPADCCNKTSKKDAYFVKARNLCNAEANNRVSVEVENTRSPSLRILMIGLCGAGFIAGLVLGEQASSLPGLSLYGDLFSLGFALVLAAGICIVFRCLAAGGKNNIPVISEILCAADKPMALS